jgi:hypothetical protein
LSEHYFSSVDHKVLIIIHKINITNKDHTILSFPARGLNFTGVPVMAPPVPPNPPIVLPKDDPPNKPVPVDGVACAVGCPNNELV